jgi:energy-converting hydrogenase Eha subunit A
MVANVSRPVKSLGPESETSAVLTLPRNPPVRWQWFEKALRALAVFVAFGVVAYALFGCAGLTTATSSKTSGALSATITYASTTRPGLPTPFVVAIETVDGTPLPAEIDVEIPRRYLSMFDENGLDPAPDAISSDGTTEVWTFRIDGQPKLAIDLDARLQPNIHNGRDGWVEISGGDDIVRVDFHTRVLP